MAYPRKQVTNVTYCDQHTLTKVCRLVFSTHQLRGVSRWGAPQQLVVPHPSAGVQAEAAVHKITTQAPHKISKLAHSIMVYPASIIDVSTSVHVHADMSRHSWHRVCVHLSCRSQSHCQCSRTTRTLSFIQVSLAWNACFQALNHALHENIISHWHQHSHTAISPHPIIEIPLHHCTVNIEQILQNLMDPAHRPICALRLERRLQIRSVSHVLGSTCSIHNSTAPSVRRQTWRFVRYRYACLGTCDSVPVQEVVSYTR